MVLLANATPAYPTVTDDDGTGQSGTVWNAAFDASCQATLNALLHSTTNTTITPKAIIDEVVTARGSKSSLDARLDVVLNEDGTLKTQDTLATVADLQAAMGARNLVQNDDLVGWASGASSAPDNFTLSGGGAAVARTGSGEADTFSFLAGQYSAKLTYGAATVKLTQEVIATADFSNYQKVRAKTIAFGCWGKCSVANSLSIVVDDGITTTRGGQAGNATYHTGGGSEEWLYGTHTISNTATKLDIYAELAQSGSGYVGGFALLFSSEELTFWPPFSTVGAATASKSGVVSISAQSFEGVKNFKAPPTFEPGTSSSTAIVSGVFYTDLTQHVTVAGATDTVMTNTTIPANVLSANGKMLRITLGGDTDWTGTNAHTTELDVGGTQIQISNSAATATGWHCEVTLIRLDSDTLLVSSVSVLDATTAVEECITTRVNSLDFTGAITLRTLGTNGAASTHYQDYFIMEAVG